MISIFIVFSETRLKFYWCNFFCW